MLHWLQTVLHSNFGTRGWLLNAFLWRSIAKMGCCCCSLSFLEPIYAHLHVSMFDVWGHVGWLSHLFHRLLMMSNNNNATLSRFSFSFTVSGNDRCTCLAHGIIRFTCPESNATEQSNSWAALYTSVGCWLLRLLLCSCVRVLLCFVQRIHATRLIKRIAT